LAYVRENDVGTDPIPKLLEYTGYTGSKLQHYVDDPGELQTTVAVHRTYLERLDAEPLTLSWPPKAAGVLRPRANELASLLRHFAAEETSLALREVRELTRRDDYERLRTAARARNEVTDEQLSRLRSGAVERELEEVRAAGERLQSALDDAEAGDV
jgi:hypothetical protein